MPRVDFKPDVDGFAFQNNWTFDEVERAEIRSMLRSALPIAAAALSPIVMAASPMIAPVAGLALGPVLPLIALAGPFLFFAAPKISEMIVNAITDQIARGDSRDNLCGGMTAAALDYHRVGWLPPRGNTPTDNPVFDPANPLSLQSRLRRRIWNGQLESHIDNTPTVVLWKAVASVFGEWGHDWLRDRTREELHKISDGLAAGQALPIGIVWKSDAMGHIVVAYALDWHGTDQCSITVYDNERPDVETIFDVDLTQTPSFIAYRHNPSITCDGIFLGSFRRKAPPPAVVLSMPLTINPSVYAVQGEKLMAAFSIRNQGFGAVPDAAPALMSAGLVVAPAMAYLLPMKSSPSAPPPMVPDLAPIALGTDEPMQLSTISLPVGQYQFQSVVMAGSTIAGSRVPRKVPNPDGSAAAEASFRVNPRIQILILGQHTGFGCARMLVEGQRVEIEADLAPVTARGVQSVAWDVSGALTMSGTGPSLVIASLPPNPGSVDIRVTVTLNDGTLSRGHRVIAGVTAAIADRAQRLCELAHLVVRTPLAHSPLDVLINPVRSREIAARGASLPDVNRIVAELQRELERFQKGR